MAKGTPKYDASIDNALRVGKIIESGVYQELSKDDAFDYNVFRANLPREMKEALHNDREYQKEKGRW